MESVQMVECPTTMVQGGQKTGESAGWIMGRLSLTSAERGVRRVFDSVTMCEGVLCSSVCLGGDGWSMCFAKSTIAPASQWRPGVL